MSDKHKNTIQLVAFTRLLELSDNALMEMIMGRNEPSGDLDLPSVHALLAKIRNA